MKEHQQQLVELQIGAIANGHLCTAVYPSVFEALLTKLPQIRSREQVRVNLDKLEWIDHLPLLSLTLALRQCARLHPNGCEVVMPAIPEREAFLERWGFFKLLDELQLGYEITENPNPYKESQHSRVLPITSFTNMQGVGVARDTLLRAEGNLLDVLRKQACLEESDISGLADLVIFELCKNVIEHAKGDSGGLAIAHASTPTAQMADVRNRVASPWEKGFYNRIGEEGVTEIVVGDSGVGIVESLRQAAVEREIILPEDILQHAFDPYSTSKQEREKKTRGLWCVKQKVRDLGGLLYVRTCSAASSVEALSGNGSKLEMRTPPAGIAAYWDFLNTPDQEEPVFVDDPSWFPGVQYQILIPQHKHDRPKTYVALHLVEGLKKKALAKPIVIPKSPSVEKHYRFVREGIRELAEQEVLFIDISHMGSAWDREAIGGFMETVCGELVRDRKRRVWLLDAKDNKRTVEMMRLSPAVMGLWREQGIMIPIVRMKDDLSLPPEVFPVLANPNLRTDDPGDTVAARKSLVTGVWVSVEDGSKPVSEMIEGAAKLEKSWILDSLSRNFAIAHTIRKHGKALLIPEFSIYEMARTAGMLLLEGDLQACVRERIGQRQQGGPRWYRLTSGAFCKEYIDDGMWHDIDAWLRNRIDRWIEQGVEQIRPIRPKFLVSYTQFGNAILARALESRREAKPLHLGDYLNLYESGGLQKLEEVTQGDAVVLLVDISGSGKTLEMLVDYIERRGAIAHVVCLIDTISQADGKRRPRLDGLYRQNRITSLVKHPIETFDAKPDKGPESAWPVVRIDPISLQPIPEVLDSEKLMSDGEFWGYVARTGTLSVTPISYKGYEFTSFIWLTGLFKNQECAKRITEHLGGCIDGGRPEKVLVTEATGEFIPKHAALFNLLSVEYKEGLWIEGQSAPLDDKAVQNKKVAILCAASTTGSGIARLLKKCELAARVHICAFINRMSNDIASAFVQKHGVTFKAFQRLYSASPSLHHGSYRTAALRSLDKYQRSCLSNRLLLYVDGQIAAHRQEHTFLESPMELQDNPKILAGAFDAKCVRDGATYDLTTTAGTAAIRELIQSWEPSNDLTLLKAILEEACCRYEALESGSKPERYLEIVAEMYSAGRACKTPDRMRELVLSVMLLERLPGDRFEESPLARRLCNLLWPDFLDSVQRGESDLGRISLRSCIKLNPEHVLKSLGHAVMNCAKSRVTELSFALELSKMRDDERLATPVMEALQRAGAQLVPPNGKTNAARVAFGDLMRDLGLAMSGNSVVPMKWDEVAGLLSTQPPDVSRTVRATIRTLRHTVPGATIEYMRRLEGGRFILADAWPPPRQASGPPFPVPASFTHKLIGADGTFFTRDLASEIASEARNLTKTLPPEFGKAGSTALSMFVVELTAGAWSEDARQQRLGLLRVLLPHPRKATTGILEEQQENIRTICTGACKLLGRPEATHVAKLGAWQYEHAVRGAGQATIQAPEREGTLHVLADLMLELLEADLCRVAVRDSDARKWKSGPLSGRWWAGSQMELDIADTDERSATVNAANTGRPVIIRDVQVDRKSLPPNEWVRGCVALPLLAREGEKCETVITLWHHVVDWFSQFDNSLLQSLVAIGGARAQRVQAIELQMAHTVQAVAAHIAHTIKTRLPERPFADLLRSAPESLQPLARDCLSKVKKTNSMRRRFLHLAQMDAFCSDGPHTAQALRATLEPCLTEISGLFGLTVKSRTFENFSGLVVCRSDLMRDDLLELLHNTQAHVKDKGKADVQVSVALRLASPEDLAQSLILQHLPSKGTYAVLDYADNGGGISPTEKKMVFERRAAKNSREPESDSLGLGLPLAQRLARKLGGDMVECGLHGVGVRFLIFYRITT